MNVRISSAQKVKVLRPKDIVKIMQQILMRENKIRRNQEHFWVVGLNNANKILFIELVSLGAANRVDVAPPEVFRIAIYKLATKLILVHNHPSGTNAISKADKDFTDRMIKSGDMLEIAVLDHLVITESAYTSFEEDGTMAELRKSGRYVLAAKEMEELNVVRMEAVKERDRELATRMKKEGLTVGLIQKITGLTKAEIGKLK